MLFLSVKFCDPENSVMEETDLKKTPNDSEIHSKPEEAVRN